MSSVERLNLARRPFSNRSPRRRLRIILWTTAGVLLVLNSFLFAQYWISSSSSREELRKVRESSDEQVEEMRSLQRRLGGIDLEAQNQQVRFLNRKIAERTFPWSDLFDDLATVLPRDVRLVTVAPGIEDEAKRRRGGQELATSIDWIPLDVSARAKSSDRVLDFIDAMFQHPSFDGPTLSQETLRDGEIEFNASVRYRVAAPPTPEPNAESDELVIADEPVAEDGAERAPEATASARSGSEPPALEAERGVGRQAEASPPSAAAGAPARKARPERAAADAVRGAQRRDPSTRRAQTERAATRDSSPSTNGPSSRNASQDGPGRSVTVGAATGTAVPGTAAPSGASAPSGPTAPSGAAPSGPTTSSGSAEAPIPAATPGSTEAIADERFGRGQPSAPRVPNASGNNGGTHERR